MASPWIPVDLLAESQGLKRKIKLFLVCMTWRTRWDTHPRWIHHQPTKTAIRKTEQLSWVYPSVATGHSNSIKWRKWGMHAGSRDTCGTRHMAGSWYWVGQEVCLVCSLFSSGHILFYGRPLINITLLALSVLDQRALKETSEAAPLPGYWCCSNTRPRPRFLVR